jgi:hypothetical protein
MKNWQLSKRILFIALVPVWAIMILVDGVGRCGRYY